ncbi:MAG: hypothetical protein EA382_05635 [Spirochaetaceae bacterium]|nr:MAG: hypothetical protein EA382_05635 [Spirochaetaceae bacterium]
MGKISDEAKSRYSERVKEYRNVVEAALKREQAVLATIEQNPSGAGYKRIALADERLNLASIYLVLNRISLSMLNIKNESFLNDARRSCYSSVIFIEEVVSNLIDAPFSDYSDRLSEIESLPDPKRYALIRKLGFTIQSVVDDYGENNKWRWSFVELEGRFATVAKNVVDLKTLIAGLDPRVPGYEMRLAHLRLVKGLLQRSADRYRERYELATSRIDDFKQAVNFLLALKRLHTLLGETQQADATKRKADVWKAKMEDDEKRAEAKRG